jgi:hypothetical protein
MMHRRPSKGNCFRWRAGPTGGRSAAGARGRDGAVPRPLGQRDEAPAASPALWGAAPGPALVGLRWCRVGATGQRGEQLAGSTAAGSAAPHVRL